MSTPAPGIVVLTTLFPGAATPLAGVFIRERMFRVARRLPITVVAPQPWFPFQGLLRIFRPHFRPHQPAREIQDGIEVWRPRFLCVPGLLKSWDGWLLAAGCYPLLRRLKREGRLDVLDAHFAYPEGYGAGLLGRWLGVPVTVTLRGTEARHLRSRRLRGRVLAALRRAARVFSVSDSLREIAIANGAPADRIRVVGNGVDTQKFFPLDRRAMRSALNLPESAKVLVTVGALVERKGFHRVMACMPELLRRHPELHYLVVGGASPEGDWTQELRARAARLGLEGRVHFLGPMPPEAIRQPLSAADVFVLATRNEGWANVLLEAMACGLPVVATDVGGNAEVVCRAELGTLVAFDDPAALRAAIDAALDAQWDRPAIIDYARANSWDQRVQTLVEEFHDIRARSAAPAPCSPQGRVA